MALSSPRRRAMRLTLLVGLCALLVTLTPVQSLRSANGVVPSSWYEEDSDPYWSTPAAPLPRVDADNEYGTYGTGSSNQFRQDVIQDALLSLGGGQSPYEASGGLTASEAGFANVGGMLPGSAENDPAFMALLIQELQRADQLIGFGQDVLRAGGDLNTYLAGRTFPVNWGTTDAAGAWLGNSFYTPAFLSSINTLATAGSGSVSIPFTPVPDPDSCTRADLAQPTVITFNNARVAALSSFVNISYLDAFCREVPYWYLLGAGFSYTSFTFVGQTWRVRDSLTDTLLVEFTVPNTSLQIVSFGPFAQNYRNEALPAQTPTLAQQSNSVTLQARYATFGELQLDFYYNDADLSGLRTELNRYLLNYVALDPHYVYWAYELQLFEERIRSTRPSAAEATALAAQIASWTSAPTDQTTLRERYSLRLRYLELQAALDAEVAAYYDANPLARQRVEELQGWLRDRLDAIWDQPEAILWYAGWQKRWRAFYFGSDEAAAQVAEIQQIESDFGAFTEYLRLSDEILDLLPAFDELPTIEAAAATVAAANADPATRVAREGYERAYLNNVGDLIESTTAPVAFERYYSRLNGLLLADPAYTALKADEAASAGAFADYQRRVHAAMATCYAEQSVLCNGYDDPDVLNVLAGAYGPVNAAGEYYERSNRFWYTFYNSDAYRNLENAARNSLATPIGLIQNQIEAARTNYESQVDNLPALRDAAAASASALDGLCAERATLASLPVVEATRAFCERIERLDELSGLLTTTSTGLRNVSERLYLPLISE
jgi:hypothetical protein